jgi:hypothetical protein
MQGIILHEKKLNAIYIMNGTNILVASIYFL